MLAKQIPAPNSLEYLPFQRAGIEYMIQRPHVLLADEMGLGKTIQAIGIINAKTDIKRALIICPASLKLNWELELKRWLTRRFMIVVASSKPDAQVSDALIRAFRFADEISQCAVPDVQLSRGINRFHAVLDALERCKQFRITYFSGTCQGIILILNYDIVEYWRPAINAISLDILCCDESHYLKNSKAQRTKVVVGHWDNDPVKRIWPIKAKQKIFMTGTPVLNRPKELWTTVRALDRHGLGEDWYDFHMRYCAGYKDHFGWQIDGASNLEELQSRLRGSIMLRRKKEDVLTELPPKRRQLIMLEPVTAGARRALENEKTLLETGQKLAELSREVEKLSVDQANQKYKEAVQKLHACQSAAFIETAKLRHMTALAKLRMAMDHLVNVLESENKIVIFAHHHDVIDQLVEGLAEYGIVSFDGRTDVAKRQKLVEQFQKEPKIRVIAGSIGAMGSGWTLTAASYVAFAELDWVPGNLNQAEDRLHRIGQTGSILVQHLLLDGSFDSRMAKSIVQKQQVIERAAG